MAKYQGSGGKLGTGQRARVVERATPKVPYKPAQSVPGRLALYVRDQIDPKQLPPRVGQTSTWVENGRALYVKKTGAGAYSAHGSHTKTKRRGNAERMLGIVAHFKKTGEIPK